jgi:TonB-dependent receptor
MLSLASGVLVISTWGVSAEAQVAQPQAAPSKSQTDDVLQEIVVRGFRASEREALDIKKNAVNVVDSIATEDLGKLPDQNVAESLQRIPGVTISRNLGDGQFVSVRGLGPQFNVVTLNGRTISTDNVGREFSFDTLPSELIVGADVYKSPTARINGASIGATIDIRTIRPLDQKNDLMAAASIDADYQQISRKGSPRASGALSWHNDANNFGAAIVLSYLDRKQRTDEFSPGAGWVRQSSTDDFWSGRIAPGVAPFSNVWAPSAVFQQYDQVRKKRTGADVTLQWKPNDDLMLTLDGLYSHLNQIETSQQLYFGFKPGILVDQVISGDQIVYQKFTDAVIDHAVVSSPRVSVTKLIGLNADWRKDNVRLLGDISASNATNKGQGNFFYTTAEHLHTDYSWDSRTGSPIFDMNVLGSPYGNPATDAFNVGAHYADASATNYEDKTLEAKLDGIWEASDDAKVSVGVAHDEREKIARGLSNPTACVYCGGTIYTPVTPSLFSLTANDLFSGFSGNTTRQWITWNPAALINDMKAYSAAHPGQGIYADPVPNPASSSRVKEDVNIAYLMFDTKAKLGSMPLAINTGLRFEDTHFTSSGAAQSVVSAAPRPGGVQNDIVLSPVQPLSFSGHYTDILPSLNVRLDLKDNLLLRFGASRVMSRPTLTDLSPAQTILTNQGNEQIKHGNPDLKPFRASQLEWDLEWYIDRYSALTGGVFYKSIDSFVAQTTTPQKVDQVVFQVTVPSNGKGATVKGLELNYRQAFSMLPAPFDGLGMEANYTYSDSDADYANGVTGQHYGLEGLSKNSYSLVTYYERGPIQARVAYTWRDKFLALANGRNGLPLYADAYGQLDASATWNIASGFSIVASGLNLGDTREFDYQVRPSLPFSYADTGRRFSLGARYRY